MLSPEPCAVSVPQFESNQASLRESSAAVTPPGERQLLLGIVRQDPKVFEMLYIHFAPTVRRALHARLRDDELVDEALNDVMFTLWQRAHTISDDVPLIGWLLGVARNIALRIRTQAARHSPPPQWTSEADVIPALEEVFIQHEHAQALARVLGAFPPTEREALEMHVLQGLSHREIATLTQANINTVKSRINRARRRLITGNTALRQAFLNLYAPPLTV